jgi:hypothetical protein
VLHLRPEGCWPIPARCDDVMFSKFLHAKEVAEFTSQIKKTVIGAPMHPGGGHVLRADGTCRYCPFEPEPVSGPCDGSCEGCDLGFDCTAHVPTDPRKAV